MTGAGGFIASAIVERLLAAGHRVVACARSRRNLPAADGVEFRAVDMRRYLDRADWLALLDGVDAVINCAGILRERRGGDFAAVHERAPKALAAACQAKGVRRFIQVSALGEAQDGEFVASKHRFDQHLLTLPLAALVIRPSVVVSTRGSYGGTSLLRSLAALPLVIFLPGRGEQRIQPILLEDLAAVVVNALQSGRQDSTLLYAVGPEVMTLKHYLAALRRWLRLPPARFIRTPAAAVAAAARVGQVFGAGPLGRTMHVMLERGNVGPDGAYDALVEGVAYAPRSVSETLSRAASFVQDRWHARLYLLAPALWLVLVIIWLLSGVAGLLAHAGDYRPLLRQLYVPDAYQSLLVQATSWLDLALGAALLLRVWVRPVLWLMALSVLGYTVLLGVFAPQLWLEPLGSLLKNLAVLALLLVYLAVEDGR